MRALVPVLALAFCPLGSYGLAFDQFAEPSYAEKDVSIADAVSAFNQRAQMNAVGRTQPPLTSEEVIAAIRGWNPKEHPKSELFLDRFKKIAQTGIIPAGCYLDFIPGYTNYNGYDYKVWWIDLFVRAEKPIRVQGLLGYNYRLRAQMISSSPHVETAEDKKQEDLFMDELKKAKISQ